MFKNHFIFVFVFTVYTTGYCHNEKENQSEKRVNCKFPFRRIGENCYFISQDKVSGDAAFAHCLHKGGYLANFETIEEAMLVKYKLLKMKKGIHYYIGGRNINNTKRGGDWRWIKHGKMNKMTYSAFGTGQPDGSKSSPQNCLFLYASERLYFYDIYCDHPSYYGGYICEQ